jgi:hypothetical protein
MLVMLFGLVMTKYKITLALIITIIISAVIFIYFLSGSDFTEKQAMMALFGNYNDNQKDSIWENMDIPEKDTDSFFSKRTGIASTIFFKSYKESGQKKFFLITKTIPTDIYFQCHACYPLISAAIFVKSYGHWKIEAQNLFVMYEGEYGEPPKVEMIRIGNDKFAAKFEYECHTGLFVETEIALLVPHQNHIENSYKQVIYYDNFTDCGSVQQCAAYKAEIDFDKTTKDSFYRIKTTRFGTELDNKQDDIAIPVDEKSVYQFQNGKYVQISGIRSPKAMYNIDESYCR